MGNNYQHFHTLLLFVLVITLCISSSSITATAEQQVHAPYPMPPSHAPAPAPAPHHHHHHHHNHSHSHHITSPPPSHSPATSPTMPPTPPPVSAKPPTKSPYPKPPTKAPVTQPPTQPPVSQPPTQPPVGSPMMPPTKAPAPHIMPPRKFVAVQGVVYCKNCSYNGVDTLLGASPLSGAKVELRCRNTKYLLKKTSTTDENGYFFLQAPPLITTYGAHKCRVFLLEKPKNNGTNTTTSGPCSHATNLNGGLTGAYLFLNKKSGPPHRPVKFSLFTVGPFAFAPSKCYKH